MRVAGRDKVAGFAAKHLDSASPLNRWIAIVTAAGWKNTAHVRDSFRDADFVDNRVVFNVGGNKYRLIAAISFEAQLVVVEAVLTHKEYDKGKWK